METRQFLEGDENQILRLFKEVYGRDLGLEFWRWRYLDNPFGKGFIYLMFDEEKLVGHYAVVPIHLRMSGDKVKAALSMTTMTHPDYQGRGIFPELARSVYEKCEEYGVELVYGFPNENSYTGFIRRLGWNGLGRMKAWQLMATRETNPCGSAYAVEEVRHFDNRFDELWEEAKPNCNFVVPRTSDYLNWRYFQKPGNEYHVVAISDFLGNIKGYVVYKIFQDEREKKGHIVDLLFVDEPGIPETIIDYGLSYFSRAHVDTVSCWVPDICGMREILLRRGFKETEWTSYFGLKYLGTYCGERTILHYKDLYLTMGDSDVF